MSGQEHSFARRKRLGMTKSSMIRRGIVPGIAVFLMGASLTFSGTAARNIDLGRAPSQIEGTIEKVWIEYGVKVKGETGIRIHTKFSVKNALNVGCSIQATVEREDGNSMLSKSVGSLYKDGKKVLVLTTFTPPYDPAAYQDKKLFIPYWALRLQGDNPNKMRLTVVLVGEAKQFARSATDFEIALGKAR